MSVAKITRQEVCVLSVARSELAELGLRLDQAVYEYADARRRLGGVTLNESVSSSWASPR